MKTRVSYAVLAGFCTLLLSGCGKDFNGFGELQGWGGYTQQFGEVSGYGSKEVGLCSYTGGCMQDRGDGETDPNSFKGTKSARDNSGATADSADSGQ